MRWLLEIVIGSLASRGLWAAAWHSAVSSWEIELFRNLHRLINKSWYKHIDPAALERKHPSASFCAETEFCQIKLRVREIVTSHEGLTPSPGNREMLQVHLWQNHSYLTPKVQAPTWTPYSKFPHGIHSVLHSTIMYSFIQPWLLMQICFCVRWITQEKHGMLTFMCEDSGAETDMASSCWTLNVNLVWDSGVTEDFVQCWQQFHAHPHVATHWLSKTL